MPEEDVVGGVALFSFIHNPIVDLLILACLGVCSLYISRGISCLVALCLSVYSSWVIR
jgi:hypothetical protein